MAMEMDIVWRPYITAGSFPEDQDSVEKAGLYAPGVYVLLQSYPRMTVAYIGKSHRLEHRIREHLANYLGFRYWLRGDDPDPEEAEDDGYAFRYPEHNGLGAFNYLDTKLETAIKEVKRLRFYYCCCESEENGTHYDLSLGLSGLSSQTIIKELEAQLIDQLITLCDNQATMGLARTFKCDNARREPRRDLFKMNPHIIRRLLVRDCPQLV